MWQTVNQERKDIIEKLIEPDNVALERESLSNQLRILKSAHKVIKKDPYLSKLQNQANAELNGDKKDKDDFIEEKNNDFKIIKGTNDKFNKTTTDLHLDLKENISNNMKTTIDNNNTIAKKPKLVLFKKDGE